MGNDLKLDPVISFYDIPFKAGDTIMAPSKEERKEGIFCTWIKGENWREKEIKDE